MNNSQGNQNNQDTKLTYDNQINNNSRLNQGILSCPKCGNILYNQNISFCSKCGNNLVNFLNNNSEQNSNNYSNNLNFNEQAVEKTNKSSIVFLVLSIVNLFIIFPAVGTVAGITFIFGVLTGIPLLICCGYFFSSIVAVIAFIVNLVKKGTVLKKCLHAVFVSFCLGTITSIILSKINYTPLILQMKKNSLVADKIIYQDDNLTVKQIKIDYDKFYIKVYFNVDTFKLDSYNFKGYLPIRVNRCVVSSALIEKEDNDSNIYYISIPYSELNLYKIKEIYMIDFNIYNHKNRKNILIKFDFNSKNNSSKENIFDSYELIYSNEYFKLYFDPNFRSDAKLYIQSLISNDYRLTISNSDFDTYGYSNSPFYNTKLFDYSITHDYIYFHPCYENMHYLRFDYSIKDNNFKEIKNDHVELNFPNYKIDKRYCQA